MSCKSSPAKRKSTYAGAAKIRPALSDIGKVIEEWKAAQG
jgi:hypothetical protein